MRHHHHHRQSAALPRTARLRHAVLPVAAVLLAVAVAACSGATGTVGPSGPASARPATPTTAPPATNAPPTPPEASPAPTKVPGGDDRTPAPSPGKIETAWGTAWEALPPGFPIPPDVTPAEPGDPADELSSGAFVAERAVDAVAEQARAGLLQAGYSIEALSGPAEDGSTAIDATGADPACRVRVTVRPFGGLTLVSILYGAGCPWG